MDKEDVRTITREILLGFWKVHILYHAKQGPVVGQWMLHELRKHGYDLSPGTLYPLLQRMERNGWLRSERASRGGSKARRYYYLTPKGEQVLSFLKDRVEELQAELNHGTTS